MNARTPTTWQNRIVGTDEVAPDQLVANPKNWRTHPGNQRDALRGSLDQVGWVQQVMVNQRTGHVVDGHARVEEALSRGEATVPVLYVDLDEAEEALVLATLDPIGAMATVDGEKLRMLLAEVEFDSEEMRRYLEDLAPDWEAGKGLTDPDDVPEPPKETSIKRGDIFALGDHRLMCGDSTSADDVARLMNGERPMFVFTSPPYNVGIAYATHDDKMSADDYWTMIDNVLGRTFDAMGNGGAIMWNVGVSPKSRPFAHADAIERAGLTWLRQIIWRKIGAAIPIWQHTISKAVARHYTPNYCHEMIFLASKGEISTGGPIAPSAEFQHDVWELGQFSAGGHDHPAAFPVRLVGGAIAHMTSQGEVVFDPFMGSGTTIIAADELGRRAYGMEIDPRYVAVAIERWEKFTGRKAVPVHDVEQEEDPFEAWVESH